MIISQWYTNLSNRTIAITLLICAFMLYFSYTFNSCLISNINRSWRKVNYLTNIKIEKKNEIF